MLPRGHEPRFLGPGFFLLAVIMLTACSPHPIPAKPALWEVQAPNGRIGWLFGTIHALPAPVNWRTPQISAALSRAGEIIVEITALNDARAMQQTFDRYAQTSNGSPLAQRVSPAQRARLVVLLAKADMPIHSLDSYKSWAAALLIANASEKDAKPANGIDRALLSDTRLPIIELEGASNQFALFDTLAEADQRVLLDDAIADSAQTDAETRRLAKAWMRGDEMTITRETTRGPLRDIALRRVLYVNRNHRWAPIIAAAILAGKRPFVAVGAAHMVGSDGLITLLKQSGWSIRRLA